MPGSARTAVPRRSRGALTWVVRPEQLADEIRERGLVAEQATDSLGQVVERPTKFALRVVVRHGSTPSRNGEGLC